MHLPPSKAQGEIMSELKDTFDGRTKFKLKKFGDMEFHLAEFSVDLLCELEEVIGDIGVILKTLEAQSKNPSMRTMSKIVYAALDEADKLRFKNLREFRRAIQPDEIMNLVIAFSDGLLKSLPKVEKNEESGDNKENDQGEDKKKSTGMK